MRRVAFCALLAVFAALPAMAEVELIDMDGDGVASFEEVSAIYSDFTAEQFDAIDTNDDGMLADAEIVAAFESGDLEPLGD